MGVVPMLLDITLKITPQMVKNAPENANRSLLGHLGTHFDVMNKEFPLEYTRRNGIVFDVSSIRDREIGTDDISLGEIRKDMFVVFYTGFIEEVSYGSAAYFAEHPQLSDELIDVLLDKGVSMIGVDCSGIRRGKEHTPKDQYCADRGVFVVENLCNLKSVVENGRVFVAHTYPVNYTGMTGLPCRVVAEI